MLIPYNVLSTLPIRNLERPLANGMIPLHMTITHSYVVIQNAELLEMQLYSLSASALCSHGRQILGTIN